MKKTILSAGIIAVALTGFAGVAYAKKGGHKDRPSFEELDTNADGKITLEEMQARGAARFAETDTNGDGLLSAEEMLAAHDNAKERRVNRMIEMRDANGDGQLSMEEMRPKEAKEGGKSRGGRMFERFDTDNDGAVTKAEFDAAVAKHGKRGGDKKRQN